MRICMQLVTAYITRLQMWEAIQQGTPTQCAPRSDIGHQSTAAGVVFCLRGSAGTSLTPSKRDCRGGRSNNSGHRQQRCLQLLQQAVAAPNRCTQVIGVLSCARRLGCHNSSRPFPAATRPIVAIATPLLRQAPGGHTTNSARPQVRLRWQPLARCVALTGRSRATASNV